MPEAPADPGPMLLALARRSLETALAGGAAEAPPGPPWLAAPGASFVTLTAGGALRGCIGSVEARRPLAEDVWENARAAAFGDPRFSPLTARELPAVEVEVSLLSPLEPLGPFATEAAACRVLRPGIDGAVLEAGERRGVFLPQVWATLDHPRRFLAELKRKAGLGGDDWPQAARLWRFSVRHWAERGVS